MGLFETLELVVDALDSAEVPHMVSGSVASAHHGESRSTQDIDIVIDPNPDQMQALLTLLHATDLYVGDGLIALANRSQFNVIDTVTGWKVDLIIRKDRPFSFEEFQRRVPAELGGVPVYLVSAEDSVLSKLEWGGSSGSDRQMNDVRSILEMQSAQLDWDYLREWARDLGVLDLLERLRPDPNSD